MFYDEIEERGEGGGSELERDIDGDEILDLTLGQAPVKSDPVNFYMSPKVLTKALLDLWKLSKGKHQDYPLEVTHVTRCILCQNHSKMQNGPKSEVDISPFYLGSKFSIYKLFFSEFSLPSILFI